MVSSTGTFVSCKDYDDDIDNLQEQINKLATKEDMTSQIATLQAALNTAAKDASDAISKATAAEAAAKTAGDAAAAAKAAAEKSVAEAKAAAIEAAKAEVATAQAALEKVVADGLAENKAEMDKLREEIKKATESVEAIVGKITDMVTSVELVYSYSTQNGQLGKALTFYNTKEKENKFGPNGEVVFEKDKEVIFSDGVIVRVAPANAELKAENISFINSNGEDLSQYVTITNVKRYDGDLLTSRATSQTGLWEISCKLNTTDKNVFNKIASKDGASILYAVAVNNTKEEAASRQVVSSFDLTLAKKDATILNKLWFSVNNTPVSKIANRFGDNSSKVTEYRWKNESATEKITSGSDANVAKDEGAPTTGDNRKETTSYPYFQAEVGTPFTVSVKELLDGKFKSTTAVKAMYVALDKDYAEAGSKPSEINVWEMYAENIEGLNTVSTTGSAKITINEPKANGDIIGFRVFAVNYDGTLVDPDGKAFYVAVGKQVGQITCDTKWSWKEAGAGEISYAAIPDGTFTETMMEDYNSISLVYSDTVRHAADNGVSAIAGYKFYSDNEGTEVNFDGTWDKVKTIKYVKPVLGSKATATDAYWYDDDKTYSSTIEIKDKNGIVLQRIAVTVKKELPTALPGNFNFKSEIADANGVVKVYPTDDLTYNMANIFNCSASETAKATIEFNCDVKDAAKNKIVTFADVTNNMDNAKISDKKYVDSKTAYPVAVSYNYGPISSNYNKSNKSAASHDYVIAFNKPFSIMFCSRLGRATMTASAINLTYGKNNTLNLGTLKLTVGNANLPWYSLAEGKKTLGSSNIFAYNTNHASWDATIATKNVEIGKIKTVKVTTADQKEFYTINVDEIKYVEAQDKKSGDFVINFVPTADSVDGILNGNVAGTMTLTIEDKYGNECEKTVNITVVPAE